MNSAEDINRPAFVVEQPAELRDDSGKIVRVGGVASVYVDSEDKAKEIVAKRPDIRTYRQIPLDQIPEKHAAARENLLRARREKAMG